MDRRGGGRRKLGQEREREKKNSAFRARSVISASQNGSRDYWAPSPPAPPVCQHVGTVGLGWRPFLSCGSANWLWALPQLILTSGWIPHASLMCCCTAADMR